MPHQIYRSNFIVISGCSGGGKSTLLCALKQKGFQVVTEPGRIIVKQQINTTAVPWINIHQFLDLTLEKSVADFGDASPHKITFFDRSIIDTVHPQSPNPDKFHKAAQKYRYNPTVFLVPPWPEIFSNDAERHHSFCDAEKEYRRLVDLYAKYHYTMVSIPRVSIACRVKFVLQHLDKIIEQFRKLRKNNMNTKKNKPLVRFLRYSSRQKRQIYLASFFSVINKIFDIAPPFLIGAAVDIVVKKENSMIAQLGFIAQETQLIFLAVVTVIVWAFESITEYAEKIYWRNIAQNVQHSMRVDAWRHIQSLDMSFFEKYSSGRIMSIINDDVNQLERFLDVGANSLIQIATTVILVGGTYFYISPKIAFFTMLPTPFILIGAFYFQNKLAPRYADIREKVTGINERLTNSLGGITTIKSYTTENWEVEQFRSDSQSYQESNKKAIRFSSAFVPVIRIFILMGFTSVMLLGGWQAIKGTMEVGVYSVLIFLTQRLLWPLTGLAQIVDLYERAMASTTRILNLLDEKSQVTSPASARVIEISHGNGKVEFCNLSFAYEQKKVLENVNICAEAGESIGIIGPKGSGKTTLMKLLLRFYDFAEGDIQIDGVSIKDFDLQSLRKNIGLVSQDVFLFQGTIKDNIAYGTPDATMEHIQQAAEIAGIASFIDTLPQGYDTIVGERGQKLSGGQRQCISIARAIVKNPPILILDEATSAVDNETEAIIQKSLEEISRNRTMIMIAHRLSTVRNANCIFVMDNGKVAESGTHEELLNNKQFYSRAWKVQTGER